MQECTLFGAFLFFFPFCYAVAKGGQGQAAETGGGSACELAMFPALVDSGEVFRERLRRAAEDDASRFCRGDAFGLAAADVVPLVFRHEG